MSEQEPLPQPLDEVITAYHEAGHAVVAFLLSIPFVSVTIIPDPAQDSAGASIFPSGSLRSYSYHPHMRNVQAQIRKSKEGKLVIMFAGEVGETLRPHWEETWNIPGNEADFEVIKSVAPLFFPDEHERLTVLPRARDRAFALLWNPKNKAAVKAVAEALLEQKTLSHDEACRIIRRARRGVKV